MWLAKRDFAKAASALEPHKLLAHTTHVALIQGYADLARALLAYQTCSSANPALQYLDARHVRTDVAALEAHLDIDATALSETERREYATRLFHLYRGDCLFGIEDDWAHDRAAHYRGRARLAAQTRLHRTLETHHASAAELLMAQAHARRLDAARLLNAVHPGLRVTSAWKQLQQRLRLVGIA